MVKTRHTNAEQDVFLLFILATFSTWLFILKITTINAILSGVLRLVCLIQVCLVLEHEAQTTD